MTKPDIPFFGEPLPRRFDDLINRFNILSLRRIKDIDNYILEKYILDSKFRKFEDYSNNDIFENVDAAVNSLDNSVNIDICLSKFVSINPEASFSNEKKYKPFKVYACSL